MPFISCLNPPKSLNITLPRSRLAWIQVLGLRAHLVEVRPLEDLPLWKVLRGVAFRVEGLMALNFTCPKATRSIFRGVDKSKGLAEPRHTVLNASYSRARRLGP